MNEALKTYSSEELLVRNGKNSPDIWVAYKGLIYDVTSSELFKDGKHYFHATGIDLTLEMADAPHLDDVMARFPVVGKLGDSSTNQVDGVKEVKVQERRFELKLIEKTQLTADVLRFSFRLNSSIKFTFNEGQYLKLHFMIDGEEVKRSYSIASLSENSEIEFIIQHLPGGKATEYLVHRLNLGDVIEAEGPFGNFSIQNVRGKSVCFICTDVGIGPVRPMIHQIIKQSITSEPIFLVYGNRYKNDIIYHDEWKTLDYLIENFYYLPCLSREEKSGFGNGYVHTTYKSVLSTLGTVYYIVGWQQMVEETKRNLIQAGVKKEAIFVQLYC